MRSWWPGRAFAVGASIAVVALVVGAAAPAGSRPHAARFKTAFHRRFPDLVNHGWTPKPLRIIAFVPAGYPHSVELADFPQAIVHSKWLRSFAGAYDIPAKPAALGYGYVVRSLPNLPQHDVKTNDLFAAWVLGQLKRHRIRSDGRYQTIVILFLACQKPQSLDGFGCASHHPRAKIAGFSTTTDAYATVLTNIALPTSPDDARDKLTRTATHELAEGATDEGPNGWYLKPADKDHPWSSALVPVSGDPDGGFFATSPFAVGEGASLAWEAADMMSGSQWNERYKPPGAAKAVRYSYVRIYSRRANHHGLDPGVPASPHPYYNTVTRGDWYLVDDGLRRSVTVTGWSTKPIEKWSVTAKLASWSGSSLLSGAAPAPRPCRLPRKTWKVGNDGSFQLEVAPTAAAHAEINSQPWCVVKLTSAPIVASPSGDRSHHWFVGFIVIPA